MDMEETAGELRNKLIRAVERNQASCMLFSGGLDTAVLACLHRDITAINIRFENYGEDINYARRIAQYLGIPLIERVVSTNEALSAVPDVIRILKTFDPAVPNDIVVYFGLKAAKEKGFDNVMTGDASDELFAGYSYMQNKPDIEKYLKALSKKMLFNSNRLAEHFNMDIKQPYLDEEVLEFSKIIPVEYKIKKENNRTWGKWIIRKAFENDLPEGLIWQSKRPLEAGSGMSALRKIIEAKVPDSEFKSAQNNLPVKFISKEHYYYYTVYKEVIGDIPQPKSNEIPCQGCGTGIKKQASHCRVCGWTSPVRDTKTYVYHKC